MMRFPRIKTEDKTGEPTPRNTPLHPVTVQYLKQWVDFERPSTLVFRNSNKHQWNSTDLGRRFAALRDEAGVEGWTFKFLRNVGGTVRLHHELLEEKSDFFLGHEPSTTSKYYQADLPDRYLDDLVDLIGDEYFEG